MCGNGFQHSHSLPFPSRPAESQRGPRGRPLSGPLHILFPPFSPPIPTPSPAAKRPPQKRGSGVFPPGKFCETKIAVGEIWCILGELMMTYNRAILGTESLKMESLWRSSCWKPCHCQGDDFNDTKKSNKLWPHLIWAPAIKRSLGYHPEKETFPVWPNITNVCVFVDKRKYS